MRALILVGLLAAASAPAQTYTVSGRVLDAVSGKPLARVSVSLAPLPTTHIVQGVPETQAALMTGEDGQFTFRHLPEGKYQLSGSRRGYRTSAYLERNNFFAACALGPGKPELQHLRLALTPNASIHGTILDSSGDPVEQAQLTVFGLTNDGSGQVRRQASAIIQQGGSEYEVSDLPPGTYYLAVTARPWFAAQGLAVVLRNDPLDVVYPLTFYGGATDETQAQPVKVRAGESAVANITMTAVPALHLGVAVPTPPHDGSHPGYFPQVDFSAFGEHLPAPQGAMQGGPAQDGTLTWNFAVAPGTYRVSHGGLSEEIQVNGDTATAHGGEPQSVSVTGRFAMADGSGLPLGLVLHLVPAVDGRAASFSRGASDEPQERIALLGGDGGFQMQAVPPGEYRLTIKGKSAINIVGAAASGGTVDDNEVLHLGQQSVTLAATLAPSDSTVSGVALDAEGKPEAGVMVVLAPETSRAAGLYRQDETDSDGSWDFDEVPAGRYKVVAIRDGWDRAWRRHAVLTPYLQAGGVPVTVDGLKASSLGTPLRVQAR